jgi:hypothetical protein
MTSLVEDLGSLALRAGGGVVRAVRSAVVPATTRRGAAGRAGSGWLAVTLACDPSDVDTARLPAPLADLDRRIEVRVRPAPGGKGTELAARLRDHRSAGTPGSRLSGRDPEADLRSALRRAKQLIEVGEVLAVDPVPHGERTRTPGGALLESWTRVAPKGGVR